MTTMSVSRASDRGADSTARHASRLGAIQREEHRERGPAPDTGARGHDRSAVHLRQVLHDRQAKTKTAVPARGGRISLLEALEDMRQHVRRDALSAVG